MAGKTRTQADQRRDINPRDQFGRKWLMTIELITGEPTGGIFPAGWVDPLRTPGQFIRIPKNEDQQSEIGKCVVDFDRWITQNEQAEIVWYQELHEIALSKYTALDPEKVPHLEKDRLLLKLVGPKPWPSSDVLKTAQAGDRRLLGLEPLTQREREWLKMPTIADLKAGPLPASKVMAPSDDKTPPETYQEFIAYVFRTGAAQNIKEAAGLWNEHRKHLAESAA